jgi:hypothetical protein
VGSASVPKRRPGLKQRRVAHGQVPRLPTQEAQSRHPGAAIAGAAKQFRHAPHWEVIRRMPSDFQFFAERLSGAHKCHELVQTNGFSRCKTLIGYSGPREVPRQGERCPPSLETASEAVAEKIGRIWSSQTGADLTLHTTKQVLPALSDYFTFEYDRPCRRHPFYRDAEFGGRMLIQALDETLSLAERKQRSAGRTWGRAGSRHRTW